MKKGVKIGLIVAVIIIVGIIAFVIYKKKKSIVPISTPPVVDTEENKLVKDVSKKLAVYNAVAQGGTADLGKDGLIPKGTMLPGKGD